MSDSGPSWMRVYRKCGPSRKLFHDLPNTSPLRDPVTYANDAMPRTDPWQWTGTYEHSFLYNDPSAPGTAPLQGSEAYQHALEDNYFQLVILDGSTGFGRQLQPEEFGFTHTDTVTDPVSGHTWRIYQRFDHVPK